MRPLAALVMMWASERSRNLSKVTQLAGVGARTKSTLCIPKFEFSDLDLSPGRET